MKEIFYHVYALLDPGKPGKFEYDNNYFNFEPFYIGITCTKRREKQHLIDAFGFKDKRYKVNPFKCNKIRKIKNETGQLAIIQKVKDNLTREEAIREEINLINLIGRRTEKKGPLTNISIGGDGANGLFGSLNPNYGHKWNETKRKNLSQLKKGKYLKDKNPNYGHKWTSEQKNLQSKKLKGKESWNKNLTIKDTRVLNNIKKRNKVMEAKNWLEGYERKKLPMTEILNDFKKGYSTTSLATHFKSSRKTIIRRLIKYLGIKNYLEMIKNRKNGKDCLQYGD